MNRNSRKVDELILDTAYTLFTTQGISYFTMDDIASRLAVSKKTLYRFFDSRLQLVKQVTILVSEYYKKAIAAAEVCSTGHLERVSAYMKANLHFCEKISPVFFSDLQKNYPEEYRTMESSMTTLFNQKLEHSIKLGMKSGVFRNDLCPSLVVAMRQQHLRADLELASEQAWIYPKEEVFRQSMHLFLFGIIAPGAIPQLEQELIAH